MNLKILIYAGGTLHILFAIFDLFWPKIFNWKETLAQLDEVNRALLAITNRLIVVIYISFAYLSFFHANELIQTGIGNILLAVISVYWLVRTIMQPLYFNMKEKGTTLFFCIFIGLTAVYIIPFIYSMK